MYSGGPAMKRVLVAVAVAAFAASGVSPLAQKKSGESRHNQQLRPPALVVGRVLDATTQRPVANATVVITARDSGRGQGASSAVLATDSGYFVFRDLAPGIYPIAASAPGYLPGGHGQRRLGGPMQPLSVVEGGRANVTIHLWPEATLSGTITDDAGDPIAGIAVSLLTREQLTQRSPARVAAAVPIARTDATGTYRFAGLAPGEFVVSVPTRLAQLPMAYLNADARGFEAMRSSGFTAVTSGLRFLGPLLRLGDVLVQTSAEGSWAGSNSLGTVLPTTLRADGSVLGYASTFYPGTSNPAQAATIKLAVGEQRPGASFRIAAVVLRSVSGRLDGPDGALAGLAVHLIPAFAATTALERSHAVGVTVSLTDGSFSFLAVPPGDYVIKAWRLPSSLVIGTDPLPAEPTLWASVPISVGEKPVTNVAVTLRTGSSIRGRVVHDGTAAPIPPVQLQTPLSVAFEPNWSLAFGARLAIRVNASYEFATHGLPPGICFPVLPNQFLSPARGWFFESAVLDGRDLMTSPIVIEPSTDVTGVVITLSDRRTTLSGSVTNASGQPHTSAAVVVFPADLRAWTDGGLPPLAAFSTVVSQTGTFSMDVRPGEYFVAAIDEARLPDWRTEATVRALSTQGVRVKINRGENAGQTLRVIGGRVP